MHEKCRKLSPFIMLVLALFVSTNGRTEPYSPYTDLYRVSITSQQDAAELSGTGADIILRIRDGYLVLADRIAIDRLKAGNLHFQLLAEHVDRNNLSIYNRHNRPKSIEYPLVFGEDGLYLYKIDPGASWKTLHINGLVPLPGFEPPVFYPETQPISGMLEVDVSLLDSLVEAICEDSLISYSEVLQSYPGREPGTYHNFAANLWLMDKMTSFGYDSMFADTFTANIWGSPEKCRNVVVVKPGTTYPYHQIIVGAHYDCDIISPGADDNGSGTVGVLEIARALKDIETNQTFIFILFDAEEHGLKGSLHYAQNAAATGDRIVLMVNMDMIGYYENDLEAYVYHDYGNDSYAQLWADLADSIPSINISAHIDSGFGPSDHLSFWQYGYDAIFIQEYEFSTVYHTSQDSTVYLNFDYMTRMVKPTLATAFTVDQSFVPPPDIIMTYPFGRPSLLLPGIAETLFVMVEEYAGGELVPGSVLFHYDIDEGDQLSIPMIELGADLYGVEMPAPECGSAVRYNVSAEEVSSGIIYEQHPDTPYTVMAATDSVAVFADDFETDLGWTVFGDASSGHWERGDPALCVSWDPHYDYDGSGLCYLTGLDYLEDVNHGTTSLLSPSIDVSGGEAFFQFALWYTQRPGYPPHTEDFTVELYHGGGEPIPVLTIQPVDYDEGGWFVHKFRVKDFCAATQPIRVQFNASDLDEPSAVEAYLDAFKVTAFSSAPRIMTESIPDAAVDSPFVFYMDAVGCSEPLIWTDKYGELDAVGLILSTDGVLSGTPLQSQVIYFTALVEDTKGISDEHRFKLRIRLVYTCGDANGDGQANIADAVYIINFVFKSGPAPEPIQAGDANCDGDTNVGDAVYMINYVFKGGPAPCCP